MLRLALDSGTGRMRGTVHVSHSLGTILLCSQRTGTIGQCSLRNAAFSRHKSNPAVVYRNELQRTARARCRVCCTLNLGCVLSARISSTHFRVKRFIAQRSALSGQTTLFQSGPCWIINFPPEPVSQGRDGVACSCNDTSGNPNQCPNSLFVAYPYDSWRISQGATPGIHLH
jgi:hypothetical protein